VIYVKKSADRTFVIVDAAMNDLIRPTLYEARHAIVTVVERAAGSPLSRADIVGPVCETGDYLGLDCPLPAVAEGELLVVRTAGAYGAVMASSYNSRPIVPEVLVGGGNYTVVRPRPSYRDMMAGETIPDWVQAGSDRQRG
jgi:diaminopimelate decarboxylase